MAYHFWFAYGKYNRNLIWNYHRKDFKRTLKRPWIFVFLFNRSSIAFGIYLKISKLNCYPIKNYERKDVKKSSKRPGIYIFLFKSSKEQKKIEIANKKNLTKKEHSLHICAIITYLRITTSTIVFYYVTLISINLISITLNLQNH